MKLPVIIITLLLAGVGTTGWFTGAFDADAAEGGTPEAGLYTVQRGTLNITLTENGTLVAKESRKVDSDMKGQAKITFLVEEGSQVEEGEVLCKLDTTDQQEQLEQRGLDIVKAEADLDTAETDLDIQMTDNEAAIEKAEIARDRAVKELERYIDGDAPKDRRNLEVAIKAAETEFSRAKKRAEDSQLLRDKDFINQAQLEQDQIEFERKTVQLESARRDMELFDTYTYPMTLTAKEVAVRDGERGMDTAGKRAKSTLRQKEVAVDQYEKRLKKYTDQAEELTEQIEKMVLSAPCPGIAIYGDLRRPWMRDNIRVGGEIWGQTTVLTIPDLRVMQVKVRIHEADINKVDEGKTAKVSMDTYPGLFLDGEVTKIASIASGDNRWDDDPEVKKFDVEITLTTEADLELKPGISAKAEVFIDRREDVLFVPLQCVFVEDGQNWVYVVDAVGAPVAAPVMPGLSNESYVELLDGVEDGDRVLLYNPNLPGTSETDAAEGDEGSDGVETPAGSSSGSEDSPSEPAAPTTGSSS